MRSEGVETFEVYSLELIRRAITQGDQEAWTQFQQCLEETVLTWFHEHPGREAVCRGLCEKDLVVQAFERFRQAIGQAQMAFETLAEVQVYLWASLHGVILDTLRPLSRPKDVLKPVPVQKSEPQVEDQIDSNEIWEALPTLLPSAREQRLAYLLYHCGLAPKEIVHCYPQQWGDVQEIYRLRCTIVERLQGHVDSILCRSNHPSCNRASYWAVLRGS